MAEIRRGIYDLPQVDIIANKRLQGNLHRHGYSLCPHIPGLYKHQILDTTFRLVVDDFGIQYTSKAIVLNLINCKWSLYIVYTHWSGSLFIGITLDWNYSEHYVSLSMSGYIEKVSLRFTDNDPYIAQHDPHT